MYKLKTFFRSLYYVPREMVIIAFVGIVMWSVDIWDKLRGKQTNFDNPSQLDLDEYEYKMYHQ